MVTWESTRLDRLCVRQNDANAAANRRISENSFFNVMAVMDLLFLFFSL